MLSEPEQRMWNDVERCCAAEAEEPDLAGHRGGGRSVDDLPAAVVAGAWAAIFLVLFGVVDGGLVVAAATALGWLLWRLWPRLRGQDVAAAGPPGEAVDERAQHPTQRRAAASVKTAS
ncbi:hypothetical protein [Geodermatophilus sp. CPCC 206100]|uniref:hypothetical protein n=1 Tax=Geodermatophilus sp. CPCC 206100 TaxID=3020054 RepID=UPI003AFF7707